MSIASLYPSINPSLLLDFANVKRLDPRITFTRTTTATYYDGVTTAKAEENLVLYSQEFNQSAWGKTLGSITANADTAPDGTATADLFTPSDPASRVQQAFNPIGAVQYVFTVYLRSATGSSFSTDLIAWRDSPFNQIAITTITVTTTWQRFTLTFTALDTTTHSVVIGGGGSLSTGENIYLWGAQLEQRSSATAYTATTSQAITNYIPVLQTASSGQARFDHNPTTGESLGLLIEEARTNLLTYSAQFDNAAWSKNLATVTANTMIAPDGTLSADILLPDSTSSDLHQFEQTVSLSAVPYTASIYVKPYGYSYCMLGIGGATSKGKYFDLVNGTVGADWGSSGATGTITSVGNGWFRITMTVTVVAGSPGVILRVYNSNTFNAFSGNGFSGIFIWGAQLEAGSFATSYIPTVASSVTRNADAASMTGTNFSSWFNNGEGTLYGETSFLSGSITSDQVVFEVDDGTVSNRNKFSRYNGVIYGTTANGSAVADFSLGSASSAGTSYRAAYVYKTNDFAGTVNGGTVGTDTNGVTPNGLNKAFIGVSANGEYVNGRIKKVSYYPIRVTNTQLQSLTV